MEVQLNAFLKLTLHGGETGEKAPSTHSIRSLDILEKRKALASARNQTTALLSKCITCMKALKQMYVV